MHVSAALGVWWSSSFWYYKCLRYWCYIWLQSIMHCWAIRATIFLNLSVIASELLNVHIESMCSVLGAGASLTRRTDMKVNLLCQSQAENRVSLTASGTSRRFGSACHRREKSHTPRPSVRKHMQNFYPNTSQANKRSNLSTDAHRFTSTSPALPYQTSKPSFVTIQYTEMGR